VSAVLSRLRPPQVADKLADRLNIKFNRLAAVQRDAKACRLSIEFTIIGPTRVIMLWLINTGVTFNSADKAFCRKGQGLGRLCYYNISPHKPS
jgi:hypothetical protein